MKNTAWALPWCIFHYNTIYIRYPTYTWSQNSVCSVSEQIWMSKPTRDLKSLTPWDTQVISSIENSLGGRFQFLLEEIQIQLLFRLEDQNS